MTKYVQDINILTFGLFANEKLQECSYIIPHFCLLAYASLRIAEQIFIKCIIREFY